MAVKITMRPNGPYKVEDPDGVIELIDPTGNRIDLTGNRCLRSAAAAPA